MATADDIQMKFRSLMADLGEFKEEFKSFADKSEGRFNRLYELVDGLAGDFKKFDDEQTICPVVKVITRIE